MLHPSALQLHQQIVIDGKTEVVVGIAPDSILCATNTPYCIHQYHHVVPGEILQPGNYVVTKEAIERLRALIDGLLIREDDLLEDWRVAASGCHDLWHENKRLRAALREAREDILLRHNARGSEAAGTDEEAVSFIDAALAGEKTND
jgi:hypothetical protein